MSQNISVIGSHSPVTDDSTGLHVQEHSAEKIAQEALSDAPPLMTDEMDKAREMTRVPDRDLSEETLARRNEETEETLAGRALASALDKNDGPAVHEAAKQLQGRACTAQMENMLEQARLCHAVSEPAESGSVALEEGNRSEDVSDAAKTQAEKPVEEEPLVRERTVSEEVFAVLQDFRPGMLSSKDMTLAQMQEEEARVDALIENFSAEEAEDSSHTIVLAQLVKYQIQLSNSITCRTNLEAALATMERINGEEGSPARKLEALVECELLWQNGMELKNALGKLEEGDPQQMLDALKDRGIGIVGKDLDVLENALVDASTRQLGLLQAEKASPLSSDSLAALARLSLRAGENPARMLDILNKGLSWASGAEYKDALISALVSGAAATNTPEGRRSPAQRSETLRYVDMVFQGAYPEYADEALALKKLLLPEPEYDAEVRLQHECTVASRHLMNILMEGKGPSGNSRTSALERTLGGMNAASARSFMLTPDIVDALTKKVGLPDFNYHLAHVAVLQKNAAEAGLFPLTDEQKTIMADMEMWCISLNLDKNVAAYAQKLQLALGDDAVRQRCMHEIQQACDHFVRGFHGEQALADAGRKVREQASLTESLSAGRRENAIYATSAEYMARLALDHHIVNLSGLIRPEDRFQADGTMTLNGAAVDEAMRRQTRALYEKLSGNEDPDDVRLRMEEKTQKRRVFLNDVQRFESHAMTMQTLAENTGEGVRLRASTKAKEDLVKAMTEDRALLHFTWPHRRPGRMKTCDTVLDIEQLAKQLEHAATDEERTRLQNRIDTLLESLKGISPFTLASSLRHRKETPTLDVVLNSMVPRARALAFFEKKVDIDGRRTTEAKFTLKSIKNQRSELDKLQKGIDRSMKKLQSQFGKENIRRLQQTIAAGLYKVFAESQQPLSAFTINDVPTRLTVYEQLKTWGMPIDAVLTQQLVKLTLAALTTADGTLKEEILRLDAEKSDLAYAGKESAETMKRELRENGASLFSAWKQTRHFINHSLLPDERRRAEGLRALLREASMPGSGFVYDKSRGLVVDTGAIFTPFTSSKSLISMISLAHPLSLRLRLMTNNSMSVSNVGGDCYQVILKGGLAASLGATMKIGIPNTPLTLIPGGNVGGRGESGLALTFKSEKDCEAFLNAFMRPDSGLHEHSSETYNPDLWLCASQVRFIDGDAVSGDVSLGLMISLFQQLLPLGFAASGSATFAVSAAGDVSQQVEQNASGETTTFGIKTKVTLAASASPGISHGNVYIGSPKATLAGAVSLDMEQRFKINTGPQGIMPTTCMETECAAGLLKNRALHDITRALLLPSSIRERIAQDAAFSDSFERLLRGMPPTALLTVHRELKPAVLDETRRLFVEARMAHGEDARKAALKKAHELLASSDSYTPTRISIRNVAPSDISRNWSPGLVAFQYARNNTFARIRSGNVLNIPLPQDA